jgi:hypothetical protein
LSKRSVEPRVRIVEVGAEGEVWDLLDEVTNEPDISNPGFGDKIGFGADDEACFNCLYCFSLSFSCYLLDLIILLYCSMSWS